MRSRGFTLVETMVVLFVMALLTAMVTGIVRSVMSLQRSSLTGTRLELAEKALVGFVQTHGRLPCPADGALDETANTAGKERRDDPPGGTGDCLDNEVRGVVPWRSLGLSETDINDGYGTRLTYRVAAGLTRDGAMSFARCDAAGSAPASGAAPNQACAQACSRSDPSTCTGLAAMLVGRGLEVRDASGVPQTTGAAYVLLSHGENRAGGYAGGSGVLMGALGASGPGEAQNAAGAPLAPFYIDSPLDATTASYFDDVVRRPGILAVVSRAGLAPRP